MSGAAHDYLADRCDALLRDGFVAIPPGSPRWCPERAVALRGSDVKAARPDACSSPKPPALNDEDLSIAPMTWAERHVTHRNCSVCSSDRSAIGIDITTCPDCGARLRCDRAR